jgi:tRNA pseudouridine38-40 synthase
MKNANLPASMRYFLEVAYNGKNYHGWQVQLNAHSVQSELNAALRKLFGLPLETIASGRTDTGVHAICQVVQLDIDKEICTQDMHKLNSILPFDVSILNIYEVDIKAHARFDAFSRTYEYRICRQKDPFLKDFAYYFSKKLCVSRMNEACEILKSAKDFQSFSKVRTDVNHFLCHVFQATWKEDKDMVVFTIEANRFLRGMVRAVVGTMIEVGLERISIPEFSNIIACKNRKAAARAVPAEGLFLTAVKYPESIAARPLRA